MSKYDMPMDITPGTIPAMMMEQIPQGADVLEFGCAAGRMTRYMYEEKSCRVWVVELNEADYRTASDFAAGGWCGDAQTLEWVESLGVRSYDRILFADVLEHLCTPEKVLQAAAALLKEDGAVLISLPNPAHFDVLANLSQNKFSYTELGLLDTTHVHFWGEQDLQPLAEHAGLVISLLDGSYMPPGTTEQNVQLETLPRMLSSALLQMPLHTVYQFFIKAQRAEWMQAAGIPRVNRLNEEGRHAVFYWDTGAGYREEERCELSSEVMEDPAASRFCLSLPEGCRRVRFDPLEGTACMVCGVTAAADGAPCRVTAINGAQFGQSFLFADADPQLELILPENTQKLVVQADINALRGRDWDAFAAAALSEYSRLKESEQNCIQYAARNAAMEQELQTRLNQLTAASEEKTAMEQELQTRQNRLETNAAALQDAMASLTQAGERTRALEGQMQEKANYACRVEELYRQRSEQYQVMAQSQCWRMTAPLRHTLDWLKSRKGPQLAYKALRYWRQFGFGATLIRIRKYCRQKQQEAEVSQPAEAYDSLGALAQAFLVGKAAEGALIYRPELLAAHDAQPGKKCFWSRMS